MTGPARGTIARACVWLGLCLGLVCAPLTQAEAGKGVVNAALYRQIPPGFPVTVDSYDDSDLSLGVLARVVEALKRQGVLVIDDAPLLLMIDTTIRDGRLTVPRSNGTDTYTQRDGINTRIQRWSDLRDERIGVPLSEQRIDGLGVLVLDAQLRDRESGEVIWKGDASAQMSDRDPSRIGDALVAPLLSSYGQTVRGEVFDIPE